jgi:hypothetical protein
VTGDQREARRQDGGPQSQRRGQHEVGADVHAVVEAPDLPAAEGAVQGVLAHPAGQQLRGGEGLVAEGPPDIHGPSVPTVADGSVGAWGWTGCASTTGTDQAETRGSVGEKSEFCD